MKPLSDSEFDKLFQKRVEEADLQFDEFAWDKMERKLQKKERFVLVRNSSLMMLLLLFGVSVYFLAGDEALRPKKSTFTGVKKKPPKNQIDKPQTQFGDSDQKQENAKDRFEDKSRSSTGRTENVSSTKKAEKIRPNHYGSSPGAGQFPGTSTYVFLQEVGIKSLSFNPGDLKADFGHPGSAGNPLRESISLTSSTEKKLKSRNNHPITLAFSAGPDYSSTKTFGGDQGTLNLGLLVQTTLYKRFGISSGLRYGLKTYVASALNYELNNPGYLRVKKYVTNIDGSCNVLEVPLRFSYNLRFTSKSQITLNTGLSSYFMLKEKYVFFYTPESKIPEYTLQERNENQHYFSVADLSAGYSLKLKNSPFNIGIEPYLKLPLSGVGEGKIRLKSSGVNLNLSYDLHFNKH